MPHRITTHTYTRRNRVHVVHEYPAAGLIDNHPTDGLARICRKMVAAGLTGPAVLTGVDDDKPRLTVRSIGGVAKLSLRENGRGLYWTKFTPPDSTAVERLSGGVAQHGDDTVSEVAPVKMGRSIVAGAVPG